MLGSLHAVTTDNEQRWVINLSEIRYFLLLFSKSIFHLHFCIISMFWIPVYFPWRFIFLCCLFFLMLIHWSSLPACSCSHSIPQTSASFLGYSLLFSHPSTTPLHIDIHTFLAFLFRRHQCCCALYLNVSLFYLSTLLLSTRYIEKAKLGLSNSLARELNVAALWTNIKLYNIQF